MAEAWCSVRTNASRRTWNELKRIFNKEEKEKVDEEKEAKEKEFRRWLRWFVSWGIYKHLWKFVGGKKLVLKMDGVWFVRSHESLREPTVKEEDLNVEIEIGLGHASQGSVCWPWNFVQVDEHRPECDSIRLFKVERKRDYLLALLF